MNPITFKSKISLVMSKMGEPFIADSHPQINFYNDEITEKEGQVFLLIDYIKCVDAITTFIEDLKENLVENQKINEGLIEIKTRVLANYLKLADLVVTRSEVGYQIMDIEKNTKLAIEFIDNEINSVSLSKTETNPFPRIFTNVQCFHFFESLKIGVRKGNELADFSFIYRRMQKDGYILKHVTDSEFRDLLNYDFKIVIDKTKLLDYCKTELKESNYNSIKSLFRLT